MTQRELTKIGKQLLPNLPGFAVNKNVVFMTPVEDILRGAFFFASTDADVFYFSVFFLPLYVPHDSVGAHSTRLRINGRERWSEDDPNLVANLTDTIRKEAIPFLNSVSTLEQVANYLKADIDNARPRVNSRLLEALAYTLIKCDDYSSAPALLAEMQQRLEKSTVPWDVELRGRAQLVEEKLLQSPEAALQQLEVWKVETIRNLKLEKFY